MNDAANNAPKAMAVSAVAASASIGSWAVDHAVYFTIGAAIAAILSGFAAFLFYIVSVYFKIKYEHAPTKTTVLTVAAQESVKEST